MEISTKQSYTSYINKTRLQKHYYRLIHDLSQLLTKLHRGELVFNYGEKVASTKPADLIRVLSEWSQKDVIDLTIRNIMVDTILSSENKQIGSGVICALSLLEDYTVNDENYRNRAELLDLHKSIDYFLGKGTLSKLTKKALQMGALSGDVRFSMSNDSNFVLESFNAVSIDGYIHPLFECSTRWFEMPHVIGIDGIIESLGEIDRILQEAAEYKSNVVICSLGYHPDVINTLSENWKLNRLRVIPFVVKNWNKDKKSDGLQACDDIGITCVSRDLGDVITNKKLEYFSTVESVYFSARNMSVQNSEGNNIHLNIRVPKTMKNMAGLIEDRIRITLQACAGIARYGILKDHIILDKALVLGIKQPTVPCNALNIGLKSAKSCKNIIKKLGAAIVPDII